MAQETRTDDEKAFIKTEVARIRGQMRITKIVATRSVKGTRGDSYAGFSAGWDTIQDDAGGMGSDLISAQDGEPSTVGGLSLKDGKVAALLLGMQVDIAAHAQAMAGGNLSEENYESAVKVIRHNYTKLIADAIGSK